MRAVTRHLVTGALLAVAAVGVTATASQPWGSASAEPVTAVPPPGPVSNPPSVVPSVQPSSPVAPGAERTTGGSRSETRSAPDQRVLAERQKALAAQRSQIARAAEELRRQQVIRQGYDPRTATTPREIGRQIAANKFGWTGSQWNCYDLLIKSESNWNPRATNPSSGAYGIPQSLPGNKMATVAPDWRTNPATQVTWGLRYVKQVYGTPCSAWSFKQGHNWY